MKKCLLFFLILTLNIYVLISQSKSSISGKINITEQWNPKLYLSEISSFDDIYKMSNSMIISEAKIDSKGVFEFDLKNLSQKDVFYRLHISKKNAPIASLIIGGKDENHFFFIANKNSKININIDSKHGIFSKINFSDNNKTLRVIDAVLKNIDSIDFRKTQIKRSFIVKAAEEKLRYIADTTSQPLASLYAVYKSNYKNNFIDHKEYYTNYLNKWKDENSIYFQKFRSELIIDKPRKSFNYLILAIIISFISGYLLNGKIKNSLSKNSKQLKLLSVQERKIYVLLKEGKSNKEISEEFNIGISTVKSHISSIYNKLNIKSRKEIMNIL